MFAVIATGGKQYRVEEGDVIRVEKLEGEVGSNMEFSTLLVAGEQTLINDASVKVSVEVVEHGRGPKIYIRKYKSGIQYRKRTGHRQDYTALRITSIK